VADTLLVERSDGCRHAVAYTSQNSIQFTIQVSENSPIDTRAQRRVNEAKMRAIRAIELEAAEGKAKVLSTLSCTDLPSEALHDQFGTVVSRRVGPYDLERHILGGIPNTQVSSKPDGGEPSVAELVDDTVCIAKDVAEVHGMIATLLIVDDLFEFEGRKLDHEPVILPVFPVRDLGGPVISVDGLVDGLSFLIALSGLVGGLEWGQVGGIWVVVGAGHRDTIAGFRESQTSVANKWPGDLGLRETG
jgi:hypothetical protein